MITKKGYNIPSVLNCPSPYSALFGSNVIPHKDQKVKRIDKRGDNSCPLSKVFNLPFKDICFVGFLLDHCIQLSQFSLPFLQLTAKNVEVLAVNSFVSPFNSVPFHNGGELFFFSLYPPCPLAVFLVNTDKSLRL